MLSVRVGVDFSTFKIADLQLRLTLFEDLSGVFHAVPLGTYMAQNQESFPMSQLSRIPDMFAALNAHEAFHSWNTDYYYESVLVGGEHGKASDCIRCGKCEKVCPQHLPIRDLLKDVAKTFE